MKQIEIQWRSVFGDGHEWISPSKGGLITPIDIDLEAGLLYLLDQYDIKLAEKIDVYSTKIPIPDLELRIWFYDKHSKYIWQGGLLKSSHIKTGSLDIQAKYRHIAHSIYKIVKVGSQKTYIKQDRGIVEMSQKEWEQEIKMLRHL